MKKRERADEGKDQTIRLTAILPLFRELRETLEQISDDVLMTEFDKALETVHTLLEVKK